MSETPPESSSSQTLSADALMLELARTPEPPPAVTFRGTERYRVVRRLGEGGFGVVFEVEDLELDRRLALKLLKDNNPKRVEWMKREFRSLVDVAHPNLVGLHSLVSDDGRWFITMDLVEGVDFVSYVDASSEGERLRAALRQLVAGVQAIHAAGKLHRDLKPSNVLVDSSDRVVILDFGLAHDWRGGGLLASSERAGGTPAYMAPEEFGGGPSGPASDWYAVGVMLYEALVGALPFEGSTAELARVKAERDPIPPAQVSADAPPDLEALCLALLQRETAKRPSGEEIFAALDVAPTARGFVGSAAVPLVGRADVLGQLDEGLRKVTSGRAVSIFVHGEPGIGKTAVCEHFLSDLLERGEALVLPARCYEREAVPFKAVDGIVSTLATFLRELDPADAAALMPANASLLARLFPVLRGVRAIARAAEPAAEVPDPNEQRRRAFAALKELLRRVARKRPVAVFIDDLQWSDLDSVRLLGELLGPPDPPVVLFVGAYRPGSATGSGAFRELLTELDGSGAPLIRIELQPMSPAEAAQLASLLGEGTRSPEELEQAVRESQGHPLYVTELVQHAADASARPASLLRLIARRVEGLDPVARSTLEVVSLSGRSLAIPLCLEAAGVGGVGYDAVRVLRALRLVRTAGPDEATEIETYHDRVREAVVDIVDPPSARRHHLAIANTLERSGGDPEALAHHFDAAGVPGRAGQFALVAAEAAQEALAFDRAARLYEFAADRVELADDERADLFEKLGAALTRAGRGRDAGLALLRAVELTRSDTRDLRRRAAEQLLVSGSEQEGLGVLLPLLKEMGIRYPATTRRAVVRMIWTSIRFSITGSRFRERPEDEISREQLLRLDALESAARGLEFHDLLRAIAFFGEFVQWAVRAGEPRRVGRALPTLIAMHSMRKGIGQESRAVAARCFEVADAQGDDYVRSTTYRLLAIALGYASGRWREALETLERSERILLERCEVDIRDLRYCRMKSASLLLHLGELEELRGRAEAQLRDAIDRGDHLARAALQIFAKAPLLLACDEPSAARHVLGEVVLPSTGIFRVDHARLVCASHLYENDADGACSVWKERWQDYRDAHLGQLPAFRVNATRSHALALAATGEPAALRRARSLATSLKADHFLSCRATRELILACVDAGRGRRERAARRLEIAMRGFEAAEMKLDVASCLRVLGESRGKPELVEEADARMRAEGIVRPERWAAMTVPFPRRD